MPEFWEEGVVVVVGLGASMLGRDGGWRVVEGQVRGNDEVSGDG